MKDDQKLFELFRENEHKLHEYPSADAWRRLEKRLDAHRRNRRVIALRPYAAAASLVLLVGTIALLTWLVNLDKNQVNAQFALLEDLPEGAGSDVFAQNLSLQDRYNNAVLEEGDSRKRFRVNQPRQAPAAAPQPLKKKSTFSLREMPSASAPAPVALALETREIPLIDTPQAKITAVEKPADYSNPAPPSLPMEEMADSAPAVRSEVSGYDMKPFHWLVGTWQSEDLHPEVFEEWTYIGEDRLKGVAYSLEKGKRKILEELELRLVNGVWTYYSASGEQVKEPPYELDTLFFNQNIFSNASQGPTNEVLARKQADGRNMRKIAN